MNAARYVVALAATSLIALTGCGDTHVAAPAQSSTETYDPCPNVSTIGTSAFVPTDWEQWCLGVANGAASLVAEPDGGVAMCEAWAILPDTELLATFEVNFSRSYAIGILDALWKLCAA